MNKDQALKLVEFWKESSFFMLEDDGFFLNIHLPISCIEKIDMFIRRDDTFFDDFIINAEYSYLLLNSRQDDISPTSYNLDGARKLAKKMSVTSPYKDNEEYLEVSIVLKVEEMNALVVLLNEEKKNNPNFCIDDLYMSFIDAYERINPELLKEQIEEVLEELDEDFQKNKRN